MRLRPELVCAVVVAACGGPAPTATPAPTASVNVAQPSASTNTAPPLQINSSGNGHYTTLTELKHRRTIYIVQARSFVAETVAGSGAGGSGAFEQPHITFVDRSGQRTIAEAPKAVLTSADKSVLMTGGVRARSQDGTVLSCERLRYDGTTERIHGDGDVVLRTTAGLTLVGDQLDGDARLENVRVYH